jgi:hypothetical protein
VAVIVPVPTMFVVGGAQLGTPGTGSPFTAIDNVYSGIV